MNECINTHARSLARSHRPTLASSLSKHVGERDALLYAAAAQLTTQRSRSLEKAHARFTHEFKFNLTETKRVRKKVQKIVADHAVGGLSKTGLEMFLIRCESSLPFFDVGERISSCLSSFLIIPALWSGAIRPPAPLPFGFIRRLKATLGTLLNCVCVGGVSVSVTACRLPL